MSYDDVMTYDDLTSKEIPNGVDQDTLTFMVGCAPAVSMAFSHKR